MSETGSDFDGTDATDSPFECLTDADGNGNGKGVRHVTQHIIDTGLSGQRTDRSKHFSPLVYANTVPADASQQQQQQEHQEKRKEPLLLIPGAERVVNISSEEDAAGTESSVSTDQSVTPTPESSSQQSGNDLLGWFSSGSGSFLSRVAEKAKNSVDSMITTLDPGMKEYLFSGGDVNIVVASDKECKVSPIREAFIDVFGRATVKGVAASPHAPVVAVQPIGTQAALIAASERISHIRKNLTDAVPQNQVIVALENFLIELSPGSWYDMGCLYLDDPLSGLKLVTYTQTTPIPHEAVNFLRFETPNDYEFRSTGFKKTIGHFMSEKLDIPHDSWHEKVVGIPRRSIVYMAACALAKIFKDKLVR